MEVTLNTRIIQIYAPAERSDEKTMNQFYQELLKILYKRKETNRNIVIIGDWNVRKGNNKNGGMCCMGTYAEHTTNRNGMNV